MTDATEQAMAEQRDIQRTMQEINARRLRRMLTEHGAAVAIDLLDEFTIDEYGCMTIGRWGGYLVQVTPMLFNDRLLLTPDRPNAYGYDHGWCYPKGGAAYLAAAVWDPATEGEPAGFKKRATAGVRQPGETASDSNQDDLVALLLLYGLTPPGHEQEAVLNTLVDTVLTDHAGRD